MNKKISDTATTILYGYLTNTTESKLPIEQLEIPVRAKTESRLEREIQTGEWNWKGVVLDTLTQMVTTSDYEGMMEMEKFFNKNPKTFTEIYDICENIPSKGMNFLALTIMSLYNVDAVRKKKGSKWTKPQTIDYLVDSYNLFIIPFVYKNTHRKIHPENITESIYKMILTDTFTERRIAVCS